MAQANLVTRTDFDAKLSSLNKKITKNKADHLIVKNELDKLKTFDSSYYHGKSHFEEDGAQNYLVFQPMYSISNFSRLRSILIMFQNGNLKDYLVNVLRQFLPLIIVLIQH